MDKKTLEKKLAKWSNLAVKLAELKAEESSLRDELTDALFDGQPEGTHYVDDVLPGYRVKGVIKYTRTLVQDVQELEKHCAAASIPFEQIVKPKYELVKKIYDGMTERQMKAFSRALQIKPAKPSLELVEVKK